MTTEQEEKQKMFEQIVKERADENFRNCTNCDCFEYGFEAPHENETCCSKTKKGNLKNFPFLTKQDCFERKTY